ncbi:unnamed protein product [Dibothriocephalus latus]|uniref:G-protein coupled receptors family 1 profile domain-containing protein n=1 Tax=Dibothriocephalus latus TaxID=60516 RepID=A0A3P7L5X8_DIBLA|nr:unnamed protein product [Dibothriocephalus latus]
MQWVCGFASINTAVMLSVDRYLVIVQPFKSMARISRRRVFLMIVVAWVWSLIWSSPPFYGFGHYIPDGLQTSCCFDYLEQNVNNYIHVAEMLVFELLTPVGIIMSCYMQIILVVKRNIREMASLPRVSVSGNFNKMLPCKSSTYF